MAVTPTVFPPPLTTPNRRQSLSVSTIVRFSSSVSFSPRTNSIRSISSTVVGNPSSPVSVPSTSIGPAAEKSDDEQIGICELMIGLGKEVGNKDTVQALLADYGDFNNFLWRRSNIKLKWIGIVKAKHRKLILKYTNLYRLGRWRPPRTNLRVTKVDSVVLEEMKSDGYTLNIDKKKRNKKKRKQKKKKDAKNIKR